MLISVIIPIYNVERYLFRCVDSVISQTYTNLEIILVDDGSTDNSCSICDKYTTIDNRVKVIHKENGGLSDARNAGLKIAKGKYVTFIDSDDWIHPNYIEILFKDIIEKHSDIAIIENVVTQSDAPTIISTFGSSVEMSSHEALARLFTKEENSFVVTWGKLYKKNLFNDVTFPKGRFHEDEFTTYKLFYKAHKICWNPRPLYYYFKRENSITTTRHPYDVLDAFEERYLFFKEKGEVQIQSYILAPLCWQLLCAYWFEQNNNKELSRLHISKYKYYVKDLTFLKVPIFHKICLTIFAKCPAFYSWCRKLPFHIRKEF